MASTGFGAVTSSFRWRRLNDAGGTPTRGACHSGHPVATGGRLPNERGDADIDAAVLIAVTDRPDPGVILTVRREHLRTHAGQVAFPEDGSIQARTPSPPPCVRLRKNLLDPTTVEIVGQIEP